jgi:hypothetical protein
MYFDNKGSLILAGNRNSVDLHISTFWIQDYKVNFNFVTCRIEQRFAEFPTLTEIVLASHLSTRETVAG